MLFEVGFDPLTEFKVVLVLSLHQLRNINVSFDPVLVECSLQHFVVVNKLMLMFCTPLYS